MKNYHETVLTQEAVEALNVKKGLTYVDCTLGNGGHSEKILEKGGRVVGIELDPKMLEISKDRLKKFSDFNGVNANFTQIDTILKGLGISKVSGGILFDLGVTNIHLKDLERGFSFANPDAPLDMRLDKGSQGVTAKDLLNVLREDQLRQLFETTLERGAAKWITGRVIQSRDVKPIENVGDMLEICSGLKTTRVGINEATLPFLALRIAVNGELENLNETLPKAYELLEKGARLVVISFHSKEDAIVKNFFKAMTFEGSKLINFKPIVAGESELAINKRSRSAKMRILEK